MRSPASLDWIRISDVIRTAATDSTTRVSRKALLNRWPTRQEFLRDAVVFALCYQDVPVSEQVDPNELERRQGKCYWLKPSGPWLTTSMAH